MIQEVGSQAYYGIQRWMYDDYYHGYNKVFLICNLLVSSFKTFEALTPSTKNLFPSSNVSNN